MFSAPIPRIFALALPLAACLLASAATAAPMPYPPAPRSNAATHFFGSKVADPYRWLEEVDAPQTLAWVKAQQALTTPFLLALPERAELMGRLQTLWNYQRRSSPRRADNTVFFSQNDGLQNQSVLMVQADGNPARELLNPNTLAADGTTALTQIEPSHSGSKLAYLLAEAGSDWETLHVRDVASSTDIPDVLKRVKFSGIAFTRDEQAIIYSSYPQVQGAAGTFEALEGHSIYWHTLGQPQSSDQRIYTPENPKWNVGAQLSHDGRYLLISTSTGASDRERVAIHDLGDALAPHFNPTPVAVIGEDFKAAFSYVGNNGPQFYWLTTSGAPRQRLVLQTLGAAAGLTTLVPEGPDLISNAQLFGGQFLLRSLHDASARLSRYSLTGAPLGQVTLPGLGDVAGLEGGADRNEAYFQFVSFNTPAATYRLDMASGAVSPEWAPQLPFDPAQYVTEQVFYPSADGTKVPMFISYKKGTARNGKTPTLLYGYGGFNISLTPSFSPQNLAWMERGGIYAQANLRGGGEYGEAWHNAGTKGQKQNVFNDFAAAAKYLIAQRYTSAKHLGIYGRSNGGLLVGATLNQHPELFAAAVPGVGVMDMLRFHLPSFTIGHAWRDDYGSSETKEGFGYLRKYSPVHNVRSGAHYPPTLTITADHDDRVVPGHSFKYAAAMQYANAKNPNVQLIRIEQNGGHGAGKPVGKKMEEVADVLAFLWHYCQ